jgi:phage tail tape-measure protein
MEFGQAIFWSTSLPVTALVVVVAIVYGYKGDEIGDWMKERFRRRRISTSAPAISGNKQALIRRETADSLGF